MTDTSCLILAPQPKKFLGCGGIDVTRILSGILSLIRHQKTVISPHQTTKLCYNYRLKYGKDNTVLQIYTDCRSGDYDVLAEGFV